MAIFIATEVMFFAGLISGLLVLRAQTFAWPPPNQPRLPIEVTGANTLVLLASAWTVYRASAALRSGGGGALRWLLWTAALGTLFVAVQGYEWVRLIGFGLTTSSSLYGATFYTIVGAHGLHVLGALTLLGWACRRAARGGFRTAVELEPVRMFWSFVVIIWPALYVLVYLT
jgi:heme/copper-type cytochrome/quinol oxidase subunit 3